MQINCRRRIMIARSSHLPFALLFLAIPVILVLGGCERKPISMPASPEPPAAHAPSATRSPSATLTPVPVPTSSQVVIVGQHPHSAIMDIASTNQMSQTVQVNYLLYLPDTYGKDPMQKWPLILFLHGRGERGDDLELLKTHPLPKILEQQTDFPFIVVSPQLPAGNLWWSDMIEPLNALLYQIQASYSVDPQRIYLTGISMGGFGTWEFALRYPKRFAAIVPIAGGFREGQRVIPENICDLSTVPIWVFHGGKDIDVQPYQSEILVDGLKKCGSNVQFTLYPEADHAGAWQRAYANPELYQWLLAQTLKGNQ
jgi:predicted peptidase